MSTKDIALRIGGTIFGFVTLLHLARIITSIPILIGAWLLPMWVNYLGAVVTGCLSVWLWWASRHKKADAAYYVTDRNRYK